MFDDTLATNYVKHAWLVLYVTVNNLHGVCSLTNILVFFDQNVISEH